MPKSDRSFSLCCVNAQGFGIFAEKIQMNGRQDEVDSVAASMHDLNGVAKCNNDTKKET